MPKKKRIKEIYSVYEIWIDGVVRYIGYTKNLQLRQKQHNRLCFKTDYKKDLYNKIRADYPHIKSLTLTENRQFTDKVEAKRWECLLILNDHFLSGDLWQKVPRISDV